MKSTGKDKGKASGPAQVLPLESAAQSPAGQGRFKFSANRAMLLFIVCLAVIEFGSSERLVTATRGTIRVGSASRNATVELSGEWAFYWGKLLSPADFDGTAAPLPDTYMTLPGTWTRLWLDGQRLPSTGCATFRLRVEHPWQGREVGIKLGKLNHAFKLYADTTLIAQGGTVSDRPQSFEGRYEPQSVYFTPGSDQTLLTLQVANQFPGGWSGPVDEIVMGSRHAIETETRSLLIADAFNVGGRFLFLILFLAVLVLLRDRAALFFSLYSLATILRNSGLREMLLMNFFPDIGTGLFLRVFLSSTFLGPILLLVTVWVFLMEQARPATEPRWRIGSLRSLWKKGQTEKIVGVAGAFGICEIVYFALPGAHIFSSYFEIFIVVALLCSVYAFVLILAHVRSQHSSYGLIGAFALVLFFTGIEALNQLDVLAQNYVYPFFFLGRAVPGPVSAIASIRIQQGLISYLSVACLSLYILYSLLSRHLLRHQLQSALPPSPPSLDQIAGEYGISDREKEVLSMAVMGLSYDEIGAKCFISKNTVKTHLSSIYRKLGVKNKTELANRLGGAR